MFSEYFSWYTKIYQTLNMREKQKPKTQLRMIVTPADEPHSWVVPYLGVKCDVDRKCSVSYIVLRSGQKSFGNFTELFRELL
jgi:hypothetical protein